MADVIIVAKHNGTFQHIFQFSDIARKAIGAKLLQQRCLDACPDCLSSLISCTFEFSALVLAKELGGPAGPLACLPDADVLQPSHGGSGGGVAPLPPRRSAHAAAAAQRQLQARLDAVVAAMQRLNQLVAQASGALAAGQAASGGAAAALALRVPLLFTGSQVGVWLG